MNNRKKNIINCQNIMQLNVNKIAANVINSLMQKCCLVYLLWIGQNLTSVTLQKLRYNYLIAYKNHFVRQLNCLMRSGLDRGKTFLVFILASLTSEVWNLWHFLFLCLFNGLPLCLPFDFSWHLTPDYGIRTPNPRGRWKNPFSW